MSTSTKYFFVFLVYAAWGFFAFTGKTPVADFIQALREALIALGVYHATLTLPAGNKL